MKTRLVGFFVFILVLWVFVANSAPIPGTIVAAAITTGDTDNTFATAFTFEIQGTMKQVPDVTARDAISADRRTEGMFCYVTGETNLYALVGGTNNANWVVWVSNTNFSGTIVAAGTNIVVQLTGNTYTVSLSDPVMVMEADAGTLVVTNPISRLIVTNLQVFTNLVGDEVITNNLSVSNKTILNGQVQLLTPTVVSANSIVATDGGKDLVTLTIGIGLTNSAGTLSNTFATGGTVTSVGLQTTGTGLGVSGTPVMTSGTLSLDSPSPVVTNNWAFVLRGSNDVRLDITHAFFPSNATVNTVAKIGADNTLTNVSAAEGALTNRGSGPAQFGAVANNQLQNSSVTVNGTSGQIDTTSASIALGGSATLSMSNPNTANTAWNGSNYVNGVWTFATNSNNTTPDMAVPESLLSTNNNFTFLAPTHVNGGGPVSQWILIHVTNTTAVAKTIAVTAPSTLVGTGYVTNWSDVYVNVYSAHKTNFFVIPCN